MRSLYLSVLAASLALFGGNALAESTAAPSKGGSSQASGLGGKDQIAPATQHQQGSGQQGGGQQGKVAATQGQRLTPSGGGAPIQTLNAPAPRAGSDANPQGILIGMDKKPDAASASSTGARAIGPKPEDPRAAQGANPQGILIGMDKNQESSGTPAAQADQQPQGATQRPALRVRSPFAQGIGASSQQEESPAAGGAKVSKEKPKQMTKPAH